MEIEVKHDPVGQKFYIKLGDKEAVLAYTEVNNIWDIHQVIVPEEFRGQGIAEKLTLHVFEVAKKNGYKIIPTCPYVKNRFLKDHPEFNDIID